MNETGIKAGGTGERENDKKQVKYWHYILLFFKILWAIVNLWALPA